MNAYLVSMKAYSRADFTVLDEFNREGKGNSLTYANNVCMQSVFLNSVDRTSYSLKLQKPRFIIINLSKIGVDDIKPIPNDHDGRKVGYVCPQHITVELARTVRHVKDRRDTLLMI